MEWASIAGSILLAVAAAIGIPLALRQRKKGGREKLEQLFEHLKKMGVEVAPVTKGAGEEKVGVSRGSGQRSEGVVEIKNRNIDYINVVSATSQYGVNYFLDYLVRCPFYVGHRKHRKTKMARKKVQGVEGRKVDIEWRGDEYLARELNYDDRLRGRLLQVGSDELKGGLEIIPEPKYEYARLRTAYVMPPVDLFEAMDIIARHLSSGW